MKYSFSPKGVCSTCIHFEIEEGAVRGVRFENGCHGNLQGIASLAEGRSVEDVVERLSGIECGDKGTSCPDQFARALEAVYRR